MNHCTGATIRMNCQDHLYQNIPPQAAAPAAGSSRNAASAWVRSRSRSLVGGSAQPRAAGAIRSRRSSRTSPPRPRASSTCSWPARRASSNCSTTSRSWPSSTAQLPPPSCSRATAPRSSTRTRSCSGPKFKFAKHGQCGAELSELLPHLADSRRRHRHRQVDGDRRVQPRARPDLDEHRLAAVRPAEHRLVDALRPRQRVAGPARLRRVQHRQQGPSGGNSNWGSGFLPTVYQACRSAPAAIRCSTSRTRRASTTRLQRDSLDALNAAQPACSSTTSAIPRSPRASTPTRWRTACRPAPRS